MFPPSTCGSCNSIIGNIFELFYIAKKKTKLTDNEILRMLGIKYDCCKIEIRTGVNLIDN